eukprot:TRINITY_DN33953_c0_g1_i1.p1 TRINITY_DN33953_c0_g1~~TRINITY_DN33953_c0_g1_i1.p1  ORF type:complete len:506 (+),score=139.85 TRINITY_DN33953_c0_g1_i1:31-1548(+)
MPGRASGSARGRGRGRGRRRESSEEEEWELESETTSESDSEADAGGHDAYNDPLGMAEDTCDEVCCPMCGEVFKHDPNVSAAERLPLKYLVTSHVLAAHPEDEDRIDPDSNPLPESSPLPDSSPIPNSSPLPDSNDSLPAKKIIESSDPKAIDVPVLEEASEEEEVSAQDQAKQEQQKQQAVEQTSKVAGDAKRIAVPSTVDDDEDSQKTEVDEPEHSSVPAPVTQSWEAIPALFSNSQTVSQIQCAEPVAALEPQYEPEPETEPEPEPEKSSKVTVEVKQIGCEPCKYTVEATMQVQDFVAHVSADKDVTGKATLVWNGKEVKSGTLQSNGVSEGCAVRYVALEKAPPKAAKKPAPKKEKEAKAKPAPKKEAKAKPEVVQKTEDKDVKRKRDSVGDENDAKKQKVASPVGGNHPAEHLSRATKIRTEVIKRLTGVILQDEPTSSAVEELATELENLVWEHHGSVLRATYRSHIKRLFSMDSSMASGLKTGAVTPAAAAKSKENE